jgi:hypothetical protein
MRPLNKCLATLDRAQLGRSDILLQHLFDLPGSAEFKVARHLLIGAATPPRRRGIQPFDVLSIHSHLAASTTEASRHSLDVASTIRPRGQFIHR